MLRRSESVIVLLGVKLGLLGMLLGVLGVLGCGLWSLTV